MFLCWRGFGWGLWGDRPYASVLVAMVGKREKSWFVDFIKKGRFIWFLPPLVASLLSPVHAQSETTVSHDPSQTEAQAVDQIRVQGFKISGNSVIDIHELSPIVRPYIGQSVGLAELQKIADLITQKYRNKGYTIAKAYLPEQEIRDGIIEISILEGKVGELKVEGNRHYSDGFIKSRFTPVLKDGVIRHTSLEKSLFLLNDYPNLNVAASLEPGQTVGTTDIVAKVTDTRPIHVTFDYNNFGIPSISRNRFGAGLEVGNALVEGSLLKVNGIIGEDPSRLAFVLGSYAIPLNRFGTKLILSGSDGRYDVGGQLAALDINGTIRTYDISVSHPFLRSRLQNLQAEVGFASKDNELSMLGQVTGEDHLRMVKLGVNYDRTDLTGRSFLSLYGFQGLSELLGGMSNEDPMATRQGADNRFTKADLSIGRIQNLIDDVFLILRGSGQISGGPLPIIEQFLLGGADSVRGYQLGEFLGDDGYTVSAELRVPVWKYAQLVAFVDHGGARVRTPEIGEQRSQYLTGAGPGLRVNLPYYESAVRFDVGFPLDPPKARGGSISGGSSPTFYIQVTARF
jgi:hemolysin activation/secretion protein